MKAGDLGLPGTLGAQPGGLDAPIGPLVKQGSFQQQARRPAKLSKVSELVRISGSWESSVSTLIVLTRGQEDILNLANRNHCSQPWRQSA